MHSEKRLIKKIKDGSLFIYPTDTIYGLGCNALNKKAVEKIKKIKARDSKKPLSIIAPSKKWILKYTKPKKQFLDKYLPGKYTLILKKRNPKFLNWVSNHETLGIRIPKNSFSGIITKANVPFITTSVNISGKKPATKPEDIDKKILAKVDLVILGKKLSGKPSTIVLENGKKLKR
jgi:tRNA threonylcarbamoyl adenosine modification protein (Sua5/YciO/YrdC/YwlC family)